MSIILYFEPRISNVSVRRENALIFSVLPFRGNRERETKEIRLTGSEVSPVVIFAVISKRIVSLSFKRKIIKSVK